MTTSRWRRIAKFSPVMGAVRSLTAVREVMSKPLPRIPGTSPVERVTYILSHENPAVFVEMDGAKFEILTKYDLMSTVASLMEQKR